MISLLCFVACSNENSADVFYDSCEQKKSVIPETGLPVMKVDVEQLPIERNVWSPALIDIDGEKIECQIKGRGNSTWGFPRKPYTIKFEQKKSVLGLTSSKRWIFLANYRDRTLMRNAVGFEIARKTDLEWTPQGKFMELVVNGEWLGNYYVCEKIKLGKNQINYDDAFLLEFDSYFDQQHKFRTKIKNFPVNILEPEDIKESELAYVQSYIDSIESILYGDLDKNICEYIDVGSFVDLFLVFELTGGREIVMPKSIYMYKPKNGRLIAGPVWDFDWSTFMLPERDPWINENGFRNTDAIWFEALFKEPEFVDSLKSRWGRYRNDFESVFAFMDSVAQDIESSSKETYNRWPIDISLLGSDVAGDELLDYQEAVESMKEVYSQNLKRTDIQISRLP